MSRKVKRFEQVLIQASILLRRVNNSETSPLYLGGHPLFLTTLGKENFCVEQEIKYFGVAVDYCNT